MVKDILVRRQKTITYFKMENQKLKRAVIMGVNSRISQSFDIEKKEVILKMNDELIDAVVEALDEE